MGWGKILTGAVIGVGAVAAAPFTGGGSILGTAALTSSLAGAGTIAAATGLGVAGAAIGGAMSDNDREEGKEEGRIEGKAEVQVQIAKLEKKLQSSLKALKSNDEHFQAIIALEAVGVACAACDGDFSANEKEEIGEFVNGMMEQSIPVKVKEKIQRVYDNPPTVEEAFTMVQESGIEMETCEELIKFVMQIDGIKPEERVFTHAWDQLKEAA